MITGVRRVATHDRTRTTVRWAIRNGIVYIATGVWVVVRRVWEARTQSRYERMMRQAELAGALALFEAWKADLPRADWQALAAALIEAWEAWVAVEKARIDAATAAARS